MPSDPKPPRASPGWGGPTRPGTAGRWSLGPEGLAEWLDACDGTDVRGLRWRPRGAQGAPPCDVLRELAQARGFEVVDVTSDGGWRARDGLARRVRGRSVLVVRLGSGREPTDEARRWIEFGLAGARLVAVVDVGDEAACARVAVAARPPAELAGVGRVAEAVGAPWGRPRGSSARDGARGDLNWGAATRARDIERGAWRALRRHHFSRARVGFEVAVRAWLDRGALTQATRALVGASMALAGGARGVWAESSALAAQEAAALLGRHRAAASSARRCATRVRRAWLDARVVPRGTHGSDAGGDGKGEEPVLDELLAVMQASHAIDDEPAVARVCAVVRERLAASAVGVVARGVSHPLAGAGGLPFASEELASRALQALGPIDPTAGHRGVEAAVPVRFAETAIGALCCRWPAGAELDAARVRTLMSAAAAACAPNVRALLDRSAPPNLAPDDFGMIGASRAVDLVRQAIRRAAAVPFPVLIEGESGSGKELAARAVHEHSARRRRRFCAVNCAAISDELFEAELFGHARGAFTGALAERAGLFEEADGGTLFLDEVAELTPRGQAKLLRVLQEGEVRRLGENLPRRVDVRVVAATNRPLGAEVAARRFRDDLRFRLDVVRIALPALRARREDVVPLAEHFWRLALERTGGRARLAEDTIHTLTRYDWPGNVRELQNVMATLAVAAPPRGLVRASSLPGHLTDATPPAATLEEARRQFDAGFVRKTLADCGGRRVEAARRLGLSRQGLSKLLARLEAGASASGSAGPPEFGEAPRG